MAASPSRDLEEYWNEFKTIKDQHDWHSDEDELSKTPDEGELEAAWLNRAGYGFVVNKFQDGTDLSDGELDTLTHSLTRLQADAVKKRINVLSTTMRKKGRGQKMHVRDIFPAQDLTDSFNKSSTLNNGSNKIINANNSSSSSNNNSNNNSSIKSLSHSIIRAGDLGGLRGGEQRLSLLGQHKGGYSVAAPSRDSREIKDEPGVESLSIKPRSSSRQSSYDQFSFLPSVSDIEISLDFHLEETEPAPVSPTSSGKPDPHRVDLPAFEPKRDPLGITLLGDLSSHDMEKVKTLAHIELTALFDYYSIEYSRAKRQKKVKEHGIFGVPLDLLVEQDQRKTPGTDVPLVFQAMISFLEKEGLTAEGILRVSGADARAKQLKQDLEEKFYHGLFSWGDASPHDVASVLKQFLRQLPAPLLSFEYIDAFPQVSGIPKTLEQLKALNLLILLLTDEHRNTLKVLLRFLRGIISHSNRNKMGLNNVAMIMAPNLFVATPLRKGEKGDLEGELKKAAGTSNIVKMLIHYQDVLWTVPTTFIAQLRHQYTTEAHRKSKERLLSRLPWKRDKDRSDIYKKPTPTSEQPEVQDGVIRVTAPHLTKSSALIQLEPGMTAGDVVLKFKGGDMPDDPSLLGRIEEPVPQSLRHSLQMTSVSQTSPDGDYLYECGGNIAERCLDPRTKVMDLYHVNPTADWVIKHRKSR